DVYPVGQTVVSFHSRDASGNEGTCQTSVIVQDTLPPQLSLGTVPLLLWPPDHRLIAVNSVAAASDQCGPTQIRLTSVESSESDDAPGEGDGHTAGDIQDAGIGSADFSLQLRAERDGDGPGRIYRISYTATDLGGNNTTATTLVSVLHDRNGAA